MDRARPYEDAVAIVRSELSPESAKIIHYSISKGEAGANALGQFGFGVAIRNLLAKNGMVWEEVILSGVWIAILKEAIRPLID